MSKIIFLNGSSSSGKTTLARAIQDLSDEPWMCIGIDTLIDLMPLRYVYLGDKTDVGYFKFIPHKNENGGGKNSGKYHRKRRQDFQYASMFS